jgi:hypothetical protein
MQNNNLEGEVLVRHNKFKEVWFYFVPDFMLAKNTSMITKR